MEKIFGVEVDDLTILEVAHQLEQFLGSNRFNHLVTLNPEMLLASRPDPELSHALKTADLAVADGFGLQLITLGRIKNRVTGNDILEILLGLAHKHSRKIYFLGGAGEQAQKAAAQAENNYPNLRIGADSGGLIDKSASGDWFLHPSVLAKIQNFSPDILVVGLGHRKQELFIANFARQLPSVKIAVGVGGAFAFYSGEIRRAPRLLRTLGLEWLWRLCLEPIRWPRIVQAVFVFPILYFWDKIKPLK